MNEAHARFIRSRPDRALVESLVRRIEPRGRLLRVVRLKGGISSATHRLDVMTRRGTTVSYVLRRFPDASWARPDVEWRALQFAQALPLPVPAPLLLDERLIVMTHLRGRAELMPTDPVSWTDQMAIALAEMHETAFPKRGRPTNPWVDDWRDHEGTARAAEVIDNAAPGPDVFRHNDYWPGNTLWHRGRLSGVIDWAWPSFGPALYEVSYWRLDVTLQRGPELNDRFAGTYASHRGVEIDPVVLAAWDVAAATRAHPDPAPWVVAYNDLGLRDTTPALARRRWKAFVKRAQRILG